MCDHIVPSRRGGPTERWNLTAACAWCNGSKGEHLPEEWRLYRESLGLPWPPPPGGEDVPRAAPKVRPPLFDPEQAMADYLAGQSILRIARERGVSGGPVRRVLLDAGVTLRTPAEAVALHLDQRRTQLPARGKSKG